MLKHTKHMLKYAKAYKVYAKYAKGISENEKSDSEAVCRST